MGGSFDGLFQNGNIYPRTYHIEIIVYAYFDCDILKKKNNINFTLILFISLYQYFVEK